MGIGTRLRSGLRDGLRLFAQPRRSGTADGGCDRRCRRGGRVALFARRERGQLADVAAADVLLCLEIRADRHPHARVRRHGGVRLLVAPRVGDDRPRRRTHGGLRVSGGDEVYGMEARVPYRRGVDRLRRPHGGNLQDVGRHLRRSLLGRAPAAVAQDSAETAGSAGVGWAARGNPHKTVRRPCMEVAGLFALPGTFLIATC